MLREVSKPLAERWLEFHFVDGHRLVTELAGTAANSVLVGADGTVLGRASEELNRRYYRTREHAGRQDSALWSALVGQFPSLGSLPTEFLPFLGRA